VKSSGFTLIEILVVLAIVGVVLLVAVPNYRDRASDQRILAAVRALISELRGAQQEAVAIRAPVTVTFDAADRACPRGAGSYAVRRGVAPVRRVCLPPDVQITTVPLPRITFGATGVPGQGMTVRLQSARTARAFDVSVTPETGAVSYVPVADGAR